MVPLNYRLSTQTHETERSQFLAKWTWAFRIDGHSVKIPENDLKINMTKINMTMESAT